MYQRALEFIEARSNWRSLKLLVPTTLFLTLLITSMVLEGSQQFSYLATAFLHGKLHFLHSIGGLGQDPIVYRGQQYWGEGLFPALLLTPFVAFFSIFHLFFYQGYIQWLLALGVFYFVFKLARILKYSKSDSIIWAFGFVLGTVFIGVMDVSSSWLFAQVVTTFLLLASLYEYYTRRRWWLIGIICGMILLTRVTAALIIIFFILELWQDEKAKNLVRFAGLLTPMVAAAAIIALYNLLRFGTPFNGGFAHQLLFPNSVESRNLGVFSPIHIPANLYAFLLSSPQTVLRHSTSWTLKFPYIKNNIFGMSIFITSPYFLWLFTQKWRDFNRRARNLLIAAAVSCLAVLCFYGIGAQQYGYRYALDFLPELFLVLMIVYRSKHSSLSKGMQTLLVGAGIFNFYLLVGFISTTCCGQ